jgi:hypothetical protein
MALIKREILKSYENLEILNFFFYYSRILKFVEIFKFLEIFEIFKFFEIFEILNFFEI